MTDAPCEKIALEVDVIEHVGPEINREELEQYLWDCLQMYDDISIDVTGDTDD